MSTRIDCSGLAVAQQLYDLVNQEIAPGTGIEPDHFWSELAVIINEFAPINRELLEKRSGIQKQINLWHQQHPGSLDFAAYKQFLQEIGYLIYVTGSQLA